MNSDKLRHYAGGLVRYDPVLRRVWVRNQRLHHGLTGVVFAALGTALIVHDWRDRSYWLKRGPQV